MNGLAALIVIGLVAFVGSLSTFSSAATVTVCSNNCTFDDFDVAFDSLVAGDTITVKQGYTTLAARTVTLNNITIWGYNATFGSNSDVWLTIPTNVSLLFKGSSLIFGTSIKVDGGKLIQEGLLDFQMFDLPYQAEDKTGLVLDNGATLLQQGQLLFRLSAYLNSTVLTGLYVGGSTSWTQLGSLVVRADGYGALTGVELEVEAVWTSSGEVSVTATQSNVTGIVVGGNTWSPSGTVSVTAVDGAKGLTVSGSTWNQGGTTTVNATNGATGVYFGGFGSTWSQSANLVVTASDGQATGILIDATTPWTQSGRVYVTANQNATGILLRVSETWQQSGVATILAQGLSAIGLRCANSSVLTWTSTESINSTQTQSGTAISGCSTPAPSASPSASPQILLSNMTTIPSMPMLCFNLSAPAVLILPKDSKGNVQQLAGVMVSLGSVGRMDSNDTLIEEATVTDGMWGEEANNSLGASQSYIYACTLSFNSTTSAGAITTKRNGGSANSTVLQLQWYLFDAATNVSLGGDVSFGTSPAYTKLTVRLANWPWPAYTGRASDDGRAEVRITIDPPFTGSTPKSGGGGSGSSYLKEFGLSGQTTDYTAGSVSTSVRLVDAVEIDGQLIPLAGLDSNTRPPVEYWLDGATSQLVLSFGRFNSTVVYDPDFGVFLGAKGGDGGGTSSDNTGLIVGVAVAVPLAILVVVAVIGGAAVLTYYRRRQVANQHSGVNFDQEDAL